MRHNGGISYETLSCKLTIHASYLKKSYVKGSRNTVDSQNKSVACF